MSEERMEIVKAGIPQEAARRDSFSAFSGGESFDMAQRMAKMLAGSKLVPEAFRGNIPDCVIALELANRIGASPLAVAQNLYIVYGRPAWSSQFLISCINASGKFSPLRYSMSGDADARQCVAWAVDKTGERLESPPVSIGMAKAEGWYQKNGSKWKTMPELMLRYRAATLFARLYAPELTMGIQCDDEVIDITPIVTEIQPKSPFAMPPKTDGEDEAKNHKPASAADPSRDDEKMKLLEMLAKAPVGRDGMTKYLRAKEHAPMTMDWIDHPVMRSMVLKDFDSYQKKAADWLDSEEK